MMNNQKMNDVAKETIFILKYLNNTMLKKIPNNFIKSLENMAKESKKEVNIDIKKELKNQNISEECKDLIAVIYYRFIADEKEKKIVFELWSENERKYQQNLIEKYDLNNMFKKNKNPSI